MADRTATLAHPAGLSIGIDLESGLDLRGVRAGAAEWSPGLAIVDDGDPRIHHALQGFLFTAGPDHIRHPEDLPSGGGRYPLHGSMVGSRPRDVESDTLRCRGAIPVALADGGHATIYRHWEIGADATLTLSDRLVNTGATAFPPMLLYHINIGGALLDGATRLSGPMLPGGSMGWAFRDDPGGVICLPAGPDGAVTLGPVAAAGGLSLHIRFETVGLPYLQLWRCRRPGVNVLGIEPCSHDWQKRPVLEGAGALLPLAPGEERRFGLSFRFA